MCFYISSGNEVGISGASSIVYCSWMCVVGSGDYKHYLFHKLDYKSQGELISVSQHSCISQYNLFTFRKLIYLLV
jgi:hypothetical protein